MRLAAQDRAKLTLLHVIETIDQPEQDEMESFYSMLESKARENFERLIQELPVAEFAGTWEIVFGKRVAEIIGFAIRNAVDLMILSSRKVDLGELPKGLASVSHQVSMLAQCPVLLVKC